jgi:hypothetical protein
MPPVTGAVMVTGVAPDSVFSSAGAASFLAGSDLQAAKVPTKIAVIKIDLIIVIVIIFYSSN